MKQEKIYIDGSCESLTGEIVKKRMKNKRKVSYKNLVELIRKDEPVIYDDLQLWVNNPYKDYTYKTEDYYILTHSMVEFFFKIIK